MPRGQHGYSDMDARPDYGLLGRTCAPRRHGEYRVTAGKFELDHMQRQYQTEMACHDAGEDALRMVGGSPIPTMS